MFSAVVFVRFRGVQNASTETQYSTYTIYVGGRRGEGGERKERGEGNRAQLSSRLCNFFCCAQFPFFFLHGACVIHCKRISILYKSMS